MKTATNEKNVIAHQIVLGYIPHMFARLVFLTKSQVAHQGGAYPGFCSMKRLGVFLLPPGWDASPSQGYPQH